MQVSNYTRTTATFTSAQVKQALRRYIDAMRLNPDMPLPADEEGVTCTLDILPDGTYQLTVEQEAEQVLPTDTAAA